jgi:hypothetical protein
MFALQIIVAAIVAFLILRLSQHVRNVLARSQDPRKDVEASTSPPLRAARNWSVAITEKCQSGFREQVGDGQKQLKLWKRLYYQIHNLENNPGILQECRDLLVSLFSETLSTALEDPTAGILSLETFSREALNELIKGSVIDVTNSWEEYLARRKEGLPREVFSDRAEAIWWLTQSAPVKFVDGAWIGHVNKVSTPFEFRKITKNVWQIMSEELGDGDLSKNHVHVYRNLLRDVGVDLPAADAAEFIHPRHGLDEVRCWKAAVAQLLISLFPHDFLPEILGFNMAYEGLPLHLLKTVKELRELRLNPYYFELHISIDNADSGHSAMGMAAVADYVELVAERDGADAAATAWKRVQAGYILADGLPTTPESPSLKRGDVKQPVRDWNDQEAAVIQVFAAKAPVAHKIHCNSRLRIGRRTLVEWLDPQSFGDERWQRDFLHDLGGCSPWVVRGDSGKSRLIRELSWEGKMFGSFTQSEVEVVKSWIDSLPRDGERGHASPDIYYDFIGHRPNAFHQGPKSNIAMDYPCFESVLEAPAWLTEQIINKINIPGMPVKEYGGLDIRRLIPLWFASTSLLESLPSVPTRAADAFGSAIVSVLRAQAGFSDEGPGVAGMDEVRRTDDGQAVGLIELGLELCEQAGLGRPASLEEAMHLGSDDADRQTAESIIAMGMRWIANRELLVGMSWGFMELHELLADHDDAVRLLGSGSRQVLSQIARREKRGLEVCKRELETVCEAKEKFWKGVAFSRRAVADACC